MILYFKRPTLLSGRNLTVRRGTKWDACECKNTVLIDCKKCRAFGNKHVSIHTRVIRFKDIAAADLEYEHDVRCRSYKGLLEVMKEHYADFDEVEIVTLIEFDY